MLYILNNTYVPNTAISNRLLGYYGAMDQLGIDVTVVYLQPDDKMSKIGEKYNSVKVLYLWENGYYSCKFLRSIYVVLNLYRFKFMLKDGDVVYTYGINKGTQSIINKDGVKVYAECTEYPKFSSKGRFSLDVKKMNEVARCLDGLFVISSSLKVYYREQGVPEERIHIVNMIVDSSRFNGLNKSQNVAHKYIAYCGSATNNKDGVDKLIHSFSIVHKYFPNLWLYIIGATIANESNENHKLACSLGVSDKVNFTGLVSADVVPQLLKDAEVCVLNRPDSIQSQYGFPTKLGEYLLSENPVVVTNVGDIPLFLEDGVSALISSPESNEEFAEKILWALNNKEKAAIIGKNGADVAMTHFNAKIETKKLLEVMTGD